MLDMYILHCVAQSMLSILYNVLIVPSASL